jgi:protein-S-isoprenylcysteine O-methyltransferase Ste14
MTLSIHTLLLDAWLVIGALYLGSAPFTRATQVSEPLLKRLPHMLGGCLGLLMLFSPRFPTDFLNRSIIPPTRAAILTGFSLCLLGWALSVWARLQLSENWSAWVTLRHGHQLVQRGPYAIVRHPIYSGLLLALLGTAIVDGRLRSLLGVALIAVVWRFKSRSEERLMQVAFGHAYDDYRARTGAMLPRLR